MQIVTQARVNFLMDRTKEEPYPLLQNLNQSMTYSGDNELRIIEDLMMRSLS